MYKRQAYTQPTLNLHNPYSSTVRMATVDLSNDDVKTVTIVDLSKDDDDDDDAASDTTVYSSHSEIKAKIFDRFEDRKSGITQLKVKLFDRFADRQSAVDCLKLHSTLQGKRIQVDVTRSNGNRVTFVCSTNHVKCNNHNTCLLYTSPSPRDYAASRMPSSA